MTIEELIEMLNQYDPQMKVFIGKRQRFGSDFIYEVARAKTTKPDYFWSNNTEESLVLLEGEQLGVMGE